MNIPKLLQQSAAALGAGDAANAQAILKRVLNKQPKQIDALNLAGVAAYHLGDLERARKLLEQVVRREPRRAGAHLNLGVVFNAMFRWPDAERHYRSTLQIEPGNATAWCNLGKNFLDQNKLEDARACLTEAIAREPAHWMALHNLATCHRREGAIDEALDAYRAALAAHANADTLAELTACLRRTDRFEEECAAAQQLLQLPNAGDSALNAFETLFDAFDWQAIEHHRARLMALLTAPATRPAYRANALILLNSLPQADTDTVFACHRAWADSLPALPPAASTPNADTQRPLRIAYLSPDFRDHAVGFFIRHVIRAHDTDAFQVTCYANGHTNDPVAADISAHAGTFVDVASLSDEELVRRVAADGIDILVDLAGHTRDSRVGALKCRAAPIQITWLGYPNTTGLDTVDYRLSDPYADCDSGTRYSETLLRLPSSFLCFGAFEDVPRATGAPVLDHGRITFGSFNNMRKITPACVALWSRVLAAVPQSRFVIKARRATAPGTRERLLDAFAQHGIAADRICLTGALNARADHLAAYNEIDIALDTFPYSGTTTTCEALWMGVPVITLAGESHAQRVSYSILENAGAGDLVTWSADDYCARAAQLAGDAAALTALRTRVAHGIRASILCDPRRFTRELEAAYLSAWHTRGSASAVDHAVHCVDDRLHGGVAQR